MNLAILAPFGIIVFVLWSTVWKGLALWHAARRGERLWFVVLLIINTVGILEIIYLLFVAKLFRSGSEHQRSISRSKRTKAK